MCFMYMFFDALVVVKVLRLISEEISGAGAYYV